jgi:GT2 family glycosyltransferase
MLSIVAVVINNLEITKRFVSSIRQYTKKLYELILIDNASSEKDVIEYTKETADVHFRFPEQVDLVVAWNKGIKLAKGDIIAIVNNDTVVPPKWFEPLEETLNKYPKAGMVHPMTFWIIKFMYFEYKVYPAFDKTFSKPFKLERFKDIVWGEFMVFKKKALEDVGYFNLIYKDAGAEDLDMSFQLYDHDYEIYVDPRIFVYHQGSATADIRSKKEGDRINQRNFELFKSKWPDYTQGWE